MTINESMKENKKEPIKITIEGGVCPDRSLQLTMHAYSTIEEWIDTFKTILIHQTFAEDTVKELFELPRYDIHSNDCDENKKDYWKHEF